MLRRFQALLSLNLVLVIAAIAGMFCLIGCRATANKMTAAADCFESWHSERRAYREIEREERERLREAAATEREAIALSRAACEEKKMEALRDQISQEVDTKLGFNVAQQFTVGQLQIDQAKLKALIEDREKDFNERQKLVDELNEQEDRRYRAALRDYANSQRQAITDEPVCGQQPNTCQETCEPTCCGTPCTCCPTFCCKCKQCKCPPQLVPLQAPPKRQAVRQPILPTEIPLMLPVQLQLEMGNPTIQDSTVRQLPLRNLEQRPTPCCPPPSCNRQPPCGQSVEPNGSPNNAAATEVLYPPRPRPLVPPSERSENQLPVKLPAVTPNTQMPKHDAAYYPETNYPSSPASFTGYPQAFR